MRHAKNTQELLVDPAWPLKFNQTQTPVLQKSVIGNLHELTKITKKRRKGVLISDTSVMQFGSLIFFQK